MNELFQQWLESRLSVPGIIACGIVEGNGGGLCRSTDTNFPPERMGEIIRMLQDTPPAPGIDQADVRWHTWIFMNGKIRFVTRPDGWAFAAAVRANSDASLVLDPLTEEFLALKVETPRDLAAV